MQPRREVGDSRNARHPYLQPPMPPKKSGKGRAVAVLGGALVVLALLGGLLRLLDGDEATTPSAGSTSAPNRTAEPGETRVPVPTPDAGQRTTYLAALADIDPGLVVHEERAIRRGRAVCDRILNPAGRSDLTGYVVAALSGGDATINTAQAKQVIQAVAVWCRPA